MCPPLSSSFLCPPFFFPLCLNRGWQGLNLNEAMCLLPCTCLPEQKFSPSLWQSKGSGTSCRGIWNRPDSRQDYCEEQKDTAKKARNILFTLPLSHTACQNFSLLAGHIQAPAVIAGLQEPTQASRRIKSSQTTVSSQMWQMQQW